MKFGLHPQLVATRLKLLLPCNAAQRLGWVCLGPTCLGTHPGGVTGRLRERVPVRLLRSGSGRRWGAPVWVGGKDDPSLSPSLSVSAQKTLRSPAHCPPYSLLTRHSLRGHRRTAGPLLPSRWRDSGRCTVTAMTMTSLPSSPKCGASPPWMSLTRRSRNVPPTVTPGELGRADHRGSRSRLLKASGCSG